MRQLTEQERTLINLITEECETPADLTSKLKELFSGALETSFDNVQQTA